MNAANFRIGLTRLVVFCLLSLFTGCDNSRLTGNYTGQVEIAPNEWLRMESQSGRAWFRCEWNGKKVFWEGDYSSGKHTHGAKFDHELPVSLRSWDGTLYLIVQWFDEIDGLAKFNYCKLDTSGTRFEKIPRETFPKQIATENLQMSSRFSTIRSVSDESKKEQLDTWELIRKLNYKHPHFFHTRTANFWSDLELGKHVYESVGELSREERAVFFGKYVQKYHPIALPTIVTEEDYRASQTESQQNQR